MNCTKHNILYINQKSIGVVPGKSTPISTINLFSCIVRTVNSLKLRNNDWIFYTKTYPRSGAILLSVSKASAMRAFK